MKANQAKKQPKKRGRPEKRIIKLDATPQQAVRALFDLPPRAAKTGGRSTYERLLFLADSAVL